jgi:hypothetical protein
LPKAWLLAKLASLLVAGCTAGDAFLTLDWQLQVGRVDGPLTRCQVGDVVRITAQAIDGQRMLQNDFDCDPDLNPDTPEMAGRTDVLPPGLYDVKVELLNNSTDPPVVIATMDPLAEDVRAGENYLGLVRLLVPGFIFSWTRTAADDELCRSRAAGVTDVAAMDWSLRDAGGATVSQSASHFMLMAGALVGGDPCAEGLDVRQLELAAGSRYEVSIGGVLADATLCWGDAGSSEPIQLAKLSFVWNGVASKLLIPHLGCSGI